MTFNITCSTDENYVQHCMAMLCSLFENNKNHHIRIHLLHHELPKDSQTIIRELCEKYNNDIIFYNIDLSNFNNVTIKHADLSIATFFRILLPDLLDSSVETVLHLDCDVIVLKDISSLFEIDLTNFGVAAIKDSTPLNDNHRRVMGLQLDDRAFCAGVLLINLVFWRQHNSQKSMFEYANKESSNLYMEDQDVLNHEFRRKWFQLPYKYGFSPMAIANLDKNQKWADIAEYAFEPIIIHYATHVKPWLDIRIPDDKYYWKYVKLSGFPNPRETRVSDVNRRRIKKTKLRYYINFYIRPFVPNLLEILIIDLFDFVKLIVMLCMPNKFKYYHLQRWLAKYVKK